MDFKDLLDYCQILAISEALEPTEDSIWRSICRSYSKKFNTPLHLCLDGTVSPIVIMMAEFGDQLDEIDTEKEIDSILRKIYMIEDPEFEKSEEEDLDKFIKESEEEDRIRIEEGRPIHRAIKPMPTLAPPKEEPKPTEGSVDLSQLSDEEEIKFPEEES